MAKRNTKRKNEAMSFYLFDVDDNIMFLPTKVLIRHRATGKVKQVSTQRFATIRALLGKADEWRDYEQFEDTYSRFRDMPESESRANQKPHFVRDVEAAIKKSPRRWQGPSWELFVHACRNQRPVSIVTARGHSAETVKAGIEVLKAHKLIPRVPNYLSIYGVSNPETQAELIAWEPDQNLKRKLRRAGDHISQFKRIAIRNSVERGLEVYGARPKHRFGMSDDDPHNVDLIVKAMCECKQLHLDKRFFVINTHAGEFAKLEVFPIDYPVTGKVAKSEPVG